MQDKEKTERRQRFIIIGSVIVAVIIFGAWAFAVGCKWQTELESLFSGWAFAGLVCTVLLQREELRLQREELEETRNVLDRSAKAQEDSEKSLAKQIDSMNLASLVEGYASLIEYYDRGARQNGAERPQADHVRARLKQLMDELEALRKSKVQRPSDWDRM